MLRLRNAVSRRSDPVLRPTFTRPPRIFPPRSNMSPCHETLRKTSTNPSFNELSLSFRPHGGGVHLGAPFSSPNLRKAYFLYRMYSICQGPVVAQADGVLGLSWTGQQHWELLWNFPTRVDLTHARLRLSSAFLTVCVLRPISRTPSTYSIGVHKPPSSPPMPEGSASPFPGSQLLPFALSVRTV